MQTTVRRDGMTTSRSLDRSGSSIVQICGIALLGATAAACATSPAASSRTPAGGGGAQAAVAAATDVATAELRDRTGKTVGTARLVGEPQGAINLTVNVTGMTPGSHGIHFHAVGSCTPGDSTAFAAAGGHHNPMGRKHGLENPDGPHAGDLPNIVVGADGSGTLETRTARATLRPGPTTLLDADGSALVVHAGADDQRTDPSGNSGARMACGVVTKG